MKYTIGRNVPGSVETGRWYDVRLEISGSHIRGYLDDKLVQDVEDRGMQLFAAAAGRDEATGDIIVKAVNGTENPLPMTVDISGADLARRGTLTVLTSKSGEDVNTFEQPDKVASVTKPLDVSGAGFDHTFPAYSVTILRLPTKARTAARPERPR
jgi:alpha-L-arabinofuranosidase